MLRLTTIYFNNKLMRNKNSIKNLNNLTSQRERQYNISKSEIISKPN